VVEKAAEQATAEEAAAPVGLAEALAVAVASSHSC